jgi:hypothetical protein
MPFTVIAPEQKTFVLTSLDAYGAVDPEHPTTISIKQARVKQNAERSQLLSTFRTERARSKDAYGDEVEATVIQLPVYDLVLKEIYLTMVDCNIGTPNGKPLFTFSRSKDGSYLNMTWAAFADAAGLLPDEALEEIHGKVIEVNPHWRISQADEDYSLGEE